MYIANNSVFLNCCMGSYISCNVAANLNVKIDDSFGNVNAFLIDEDFLSYNIIIGCDYLNQPQIAMVKLRNTLWLRNICVTHIQNISQSQLKLDMINFGDVSEQEKQSILKFLWEYKDKISFSLNNIGKTDVVKMRIVCNSDTPIVYNPYRMSIHEKG